jgi:hypothetical protein
MADPHFLQMLSRRLADEGKLIEAGWAALRVGMPQTYAPSDLTVMRMVYMSGAQHLFASIMSILEDGADETPADLRRMDLIAQELEVFRKELELAVAKPAGQG